MSNYHHLLTLSLRLLLIAAVLTLAGCGGEPDEQQLNQTVAERIAGTFGEGTLKLTSLRRLGSAPLNATDDGASQRLVYYNAVLTFARDLDFSSWDTLNISAFATLLGATEKGIEGIKQDGNQAGDQLRVRGSVAFADRDGQWTPVASVRPEAAATGPRRGSQNSRQTIERINALLSRETSDPNAQREIIDEELKRAYRDITQRLDRLDRALIIAGGPEYGEYNRLARILVAELNRQGMSSTNVTSSGSTQNIHLMRQGKADLALVQNNVARHAHLGTGPFEPDGPFYGLQALASLFPEPIHIIVAKDSPIKRIADLKQKRVDIGRPSSGARHTAIAVLESAGLGLKDLAAIHETGLKSGLALLQKGEIDAVIATIAAPALALQRSAAKGTIRLLPLAQEERDALVARGNVYVPVSLPPSTYPRQNSAITTVAVTALLASRAELPAGDVQTVLKVLFDDIDFVRAGSSAGSLVTRNTARAGLSIPLHPAALEFFGGAAEAGEAETSASAPVARREQEAVQDR